MIYVALSGDTLPCSALHTAFRNSSVETREQENAKMVRKMSKTFHNFRDSL